MGSLGGRSCRVAHPSPSVMSRHRNPGLGGGRAGKGPTFPMTGGCFPWALTCGSKVVPGGLWGLEVAGSEGRGGRLWNHRITKVGRNPRDHPVQPQQHHQRDLGRARTGAGHLPRLRSCRCADAGALQRRDLPPVQNPGKVGWGWSRGVPSPGQGRGRIRGIAAREAPGTRPQRLPKLPRGRAEPPQRLSQPGEEKRGSSLKTGMCTWIFRDAPHGWDSEMFPRCVLQMQV